MKALVLSGGTGTRLRPFSHSMPKQLIPIANKPVLEHVLDNIRAVGITDIGIIVGDRGPAIAEVLGDGSRMGVRLTYLRQDRPLGLAHCVTVARSFLADDDFLMYLGDNMLPDGIGDVAADFHRHRPDAHVVVHKVADPRAFGVAQMGAGDSVVRLVEKPREPPSNLALIGVYLFTPAIHDAVAAIRPSARGELEITDAIQYMVERNADVRATEYAGYWKDTGSAEDVLDCNRTLLQDLPRAIDGEVDAGSTVTGRVVIEAGARVVRSRIEGPAIIGAGTVVEDSRIGAGTSIGNDCVLRACGISDSIVLDRASITDVTGLHGSLIGRGARVGAAHRGAARHRLMVGDDTRIEMAA
ncbi:glucose-1-phosphate thymidylyltransferase [Streptomyces sp. NPDC059506]|uniref:glucose-1-phosphate thymidylyltransferase n=1 Tax=unclassified Streptomyces TaxID=2593676 RepID=UPI000CB48FB8|nr:glucose-1-phosphate thymidylyltransferase [Streptomyces sp. SCUT-3]PLW71514.1 glucose-1-phosphate thymidylyltransferase [Streptomyces sp. DJ]QMV21225.1 glucose-1-phosphate thymidylyltransferase [Streptomyces sp. SCUT-3]